MDATEEQLDKVEERLELKLPLPTRLMTVFHDRQDYNERIVGLIGGTNYSVHDGLVNVNLFPLFVVTALGMTQFSSKFDFSSTSKYIAVVAAFIARTERYFFLNCVNMQLYVPTANRQEEMMPCVPSALLKSSGDRQCDGLLLWLEEHVRRLQSGMITVCEEDDRKMIRQFPHKPPLCSIAVTNSVQVCASAVLVPERSDVHNSEFVFVYSVRMSFLPEGCTVNGIKFNSSMKMRPSTKRLTWKPPQERWLLHMKFHGDWRLTRKQPFCLSQGRDKGCVYLTNGGCI